MFAFFSTGSLRNGWFAVCIKYLPWLCLTVTFESQEELCSDSVERIVVNPNAAYDKFKDKHINTKGLGEFKLQMDCLCCPFLVELY